MNEENKVPNCNKCPHRNFVMDGNCYRWARCSAQGWKKCEFAYGTDECYKLYKVKDEN